MRNDFEFIKKMKRKLLLKGEDRQGSIIVCVDERDFQNLIRLAEYALRD